jgi:hypothetical protein
MKSYKLIEEEVREELARKGHLRWMLRAGAVIAVAGLVIYWYRKVSLRKKLRVISNAGYETAFDIHYPLKHNRPGKKQKPGRA